MRLDFKLMRYSAALSSSVLSAGALSFGGYWAGNRLDRWLHTSPLLAIGLLLVGICLGLFYILYIAQRLKP
jgi:F0F1-type ATP synthase assembly protein I